MDGEEQRGHDRRQAERAVGEPGRMPEQAQRDEIENRGVEGEDHEAGQMVAGRVHSPDDVVEAEREPGERDPMAHQHRAEHPPDLRPCEAPIVLVLDQIHVVVPRHESVPERGQEDQERDQGKRQRDDPGAKDNAERGRERAERALVRSRGRARRDLDAFHPWHDSPLSTRGKRFSACRHTHARKGVPLPRVV